MQLQENKAIVVDEPGVTRDRLYGRSYWGDQEFVVVDTGGVMTVSKSPAGVMEELNVSTTIGMEGIPLSSREAAVARMPSMIEKQATAAVEESDVIVFVVDGQVRFLSSNKLQRFCLWLINFFWLLMDGNDFFGTRSIRRQGLQVLMWRLQTGCGSTIHIRISSSR